MADQDFNITIKTVADTTGIKLTKEGLDSIKIAALQGNKEAIAALQNLTNAVRQAQSASGGVGGLVSGFAGGVASGLLGSLIGSLHAFVEEDRKVFEAMEKRQEKMKELGESIIKVQDAEIEERTRGVQPLEQQYIALQEKLLRLRTERGLVNQDTIEGRNEWLNYAKPIHDASSELDKITAALQRKNKDPNASAAPVIPGPKAGKGESQALVDEIERNRRAFEEQQKEDIWELDPETGAYRRTGEKRFPLFIPNPTPQPMPPPGTPSTGGNVPLTADIGEKIDKLSEKFDRYWG